MCNQIERKYSEQRIGPYLTAEERDTVCDEMVKRVNRPYRMSEEHDEYQAALLEFAELLSDD